jgi:hypothetical protein
VSAEQIAESLSAQEDVALQRLDRAAKAQQLMENGLVAEAFQGVREAMLAEIERAPLATNIDALRKGLWCLSEVKKLVEKHIETGKIAQKDMAHIRQQRERLGIMNRLRRVA